MAEAPNTNGTMAQTKVVYGDKLIRLPFEVGIMGELIPFNDKKRTGANFQFPVVVTMEHGATYNGTDGLGTTLNSSVKSTTVMEQVTPYEFIMKAQLAARLIDDTKGDAAAFEDATRLVLENLMTSAEFREEHSLIYGQSGIFKVDANNGGVLTITDATWSAATADGLEGAILEAFDALTASANQHNTDLTVSAVDLDAKTITVTGTSSAVVQNDWLFFKGARTTTGFKEMLGVYSLCTLTSGTIHNQNIATYSKLRPNVKSSAGAPTMSMFLSGISKITGRRVRKRETTLIVPVQAFDRVASDLQASRRFDSSWSRKAGNGYEYIQFYSSLGLTDLIPHPMLRDSDAIAFTKKNGMRIGSKPLGWRPGPGGDEDLWIADQTTTCYEARVAAIEQPVFERPSECVGFTGISTS